MHRQMRAIYLIPAATVLLAAAIALVVALTSMGAVAAVRPVDAGFQGYRGARDLGISSPVGATSIP